MKLTRNQWILVAIGALVILILWFMAKQAGTSGAGATTDTREETSAGDATLRAPTEDGRVATVELRREHDILI